MALKYQQTRVVQAGTSEVIALVGDKDPFLCVVEPIGGTADVEYSASDDFTGAVKEVGVSQTVLAATFVATGSILDFGLQTRAELGLNYVGDTFEIQGTVSNDGFYRVLNILSDTAIQCQKIGGAVVDEVAPPNITLLSGPTGGEAAIWVPWAAGQVAAITAETLPGAPNAVRVTATGGDVIAEIAGAS